MILQVKNYLLKQLLVLFTKHLWYLPITITIIIIEKNFQLVNDKYKITFLKRD